MKVIAHANNWPLTLAFYIHYFYPGTSEFYVGTGPGMPRCSYATDGFLLGKHEELTDIARPSDLWRMGTMVIGQNEASWRGRYGVLATRLVVVFRRIPRFPESSKWLV